MSPRSATRPTLATKRLIPLLRVSQRKGRGENGKSFMSPEQQLDLIEGWAKANPPIELLEPVDETDSVSGSAANWENRKDLKWAMEQVMTGQADGIIVAKIDRWARSAIEGGLAIRELRQADKAFVSVTEGIDSWDPKDPNANFILGIWLLVAQWIWETLTAGWEDVRERHIAAGIANVWPYGYRRLPKEEGRTLVPHPDQAPWVEHIFKQRARGVAWPEIARSLNEAGVPSATGGQWTYGYIRAIVRNRVYLGELRSGEYINEQAHEAIVPRGLWEEANATLTTNVNNRRSRTYPLTGIIRCAACGGLMKGNTDHLKPEVHHVAEERFVRYYRCRRSFSWGSCPRPAIVKADDVEALVFERFKEDHLTHRRYDARTSHTELDAAEDRLSAAEAEARAFAAAPETMRMRQLMGEGAVAEAMNARLDAVARAMAERDDLRADLLGLRLPGDLEEVWPAMEDDERRAVLKVAYHCVAVRPLAERARVPRGTPLAGQFATEPVADRVRIWARGEAGAPDGLPGRGGAAAIRPINF